MSRSERLMPAPAGRDKIEERLGQGGAERCSRVVRELGTDGKILP